MKYLIISDIHGSYKYLMDVLNEQKDFDMLLILGDVLPHGPRNDLPLEYNPKKIIPVLNDLKNKIICIKGNCDAYVDTMVLDFPILDQAAIVINNKKIYLTHGHIYNPINKLNIDEGICLYGHTHISKIEKIDNVYYVNPGSISIPKDGHHSYAVIEDNKLIIKEINGPTLKELSLEDVVC